LRVFGDFADARLLVGLEHRGFDRVLALHGRLAMFDTVDPALVNAPFFQTLLSNDVSLPCEEAKTTMPPFSADVTVFISLVTSTAKRTAAPPAWQCRGTRSPFPARSAARRRTSSCDSPLPSACSSVTSKGR
jgi:hypothetical protein